MTIARSTNATAGISSLTMSPWVSATMAFRLLARDGGQQLDQRRRDQEQDRAQADALPALAIVPGAAGDARDLPGGDGGDGRRRDGDARLQAEVNPQREREVREGDERDVDARGPRGTPAHDEGA